MLNASYIKNGMNVNSCTIHLVRKKGLADCKVYRIIIKWHVCHGKLVLCANSHTVNTAVAFYVFGISSQPPLSRLVFGEKNKTNAICLRLTT